MNQLIRLKRRTSPILILVSLVSVALLPGVQAVVPAPDGGYPGFNTAEGTNALKNLTTGVGNAAVGWYSLFSNADGSFNTAVGAGTLLFNIGDQSTGEGIQNTAVGTAALLFNTTGQQNTATGVFALEANTIGSVNSALGFGALENNTEGSDNTAMGAFALAANTIGNFNTASGAAALQTNTTGLFNTASGYGALTGNTAGSSNTALGKLAGFSTTGDGNVCIGADVFGVDGESNTTRIRNIGSTPIVGGTTVVVESTGGIGDARIGYASSSRRYKQEIKPMDKASEMLFALKPVTFRAKPNLGSAGIMRYGLIAEDVESVDPNLVVYNAEGKPETLRFDSINAMLLNEFLKAHRAVQELKSNAAKQEATIAHQQRQIEALTAGLQKVSARIKLSKTAPETIAKNQ
jgi:trimeric autotransporter adhesin